MNTRGLLKPGKARRPNACFPPIADVPRQCELTGVKDLQLSARSLIRALVAATLSTSAAAEVPLAIAPTGHATVPVSGSFGVQQFVIDTGAEGTAVYADLASQAGLAASGSTNLQGQTGASEVPLINVGMLTLDGVVKGPIEAVSLPPRADGVRLAGIVGLDVFGDRTLDFNLARHTVRLLPAGSHPKLNSLPIKASPTVGGLLTVPVNIGGVSATAVIDTGARKTRINWALGRLIGLDSAKLARGDTIQGATNNSVETGSTRLPQVQIANRTMTDMPVLVADLPVFEAFGVARKPAVILGLDWLMDTRMVIDFPARLVWFEQAS